MALAMREQMILNLICSVIALGALGAVAWYLITGRASQDGIDGLFWIFSFLVAAVLFSLMPLQSLRAALPRGLLKRLRRKAQTDREQQIAQAVSQKQ